MLPDMHILWYVSKIWSWKLDDILFISSTDVWCKKHYQLPVPNSCPSISFLLPGHPPYAAESSPACTMRPPRAKYMWLKAVNHEWDSLKLKTLLSGLPLNCKASVFKWETPGWTVNSRPRQGHTWLPGRDRHDTVLDSSWSQPVLPNIWGVHSLTIAVNPAMLW